MKTKVKLQYGVLGKCIFCGGNVVQRLKENVQNPLKVRRSHRALKGFYCSTCGLRYEFVPPQYIHDKMAELIKHSHAACVEAKPVDDGSIDVDLEGFVDHTPTGEYDGYTLDGEEVDEKSDVN